MWFFVQCNNYAHALRSVPDGYKDQQMCDKAVSTHPSIIQFVPDLFKTQEM